MDESYPLNARRNKARTQDHVFYVFQLDVPRDTVNLDRVREGIAGKGRHVRGLGQGLSGEFRHLRAIVHRPRRSIPMSDKRVLQKGLRGAAHVENLHVKFETTPKRCSIQTASARANVITVGVNLPDLRPVARLPANPHIGHKRHAEFILARRYFAARLAVVVSRARAKARRIPQLQILVHINFVRGAAVDGVGSGR